MLDVCEAETSSENDIVRSLSVSLSVLSAVSSVAAIILCCKADPKMSSNGDLSDPGSSDSFWEVQREHAHSPSAPLLFCVVVAPRLSLPSVAGSSAAGELQADGEAHRRRPPAVQRHGQLLPGPGEDREGLRSAAERLGQEVEGRGGER